MNKTRAELLKEIEARMRDNGIFYQDIWDRILQTETRVLVKISESDFDLQVLKMQAEIKGRN